MFNYAFVQPTVFRVGVGASERPAGLIFIENSDLKINRSGQPSQLHRLPATSTDGQPDEILEKIEAEGPRSH
jgi:hypothetical protein